MKVRGGLKTSTVKGQLMLRLSWKEVAKSSWQFICLFVAVKIHIFAADYFFAIRKHFLSSHVMLRWLNTMFRFSANKQNRF